MGATVITIYFVALFCKILGIPVAKEIPWLWFLLIPLLWVLVKLIWPVFQVVLCIFFIWWFMEFMVWVMVPGYHIHLFGLLGTIGHSIIG
jgi:hypothetical protein